MHTVVNGHKERRILKRMKPRPNARKIIALLDEDMLKEIDEIRFKRRFLTRVETIRALLRTAIDRELRKAPKPAKKGE
jgi:metal-responsive CopG/Arc/MetJ family transcriptional regulator